ncbi:MAG: DUF2442 domain-containing protein [Deltaproteobacteria bacterium]|nr:DUF2442 domain-containing protein [Deltaproteobacteria bacterium]
MLLDVVTVTAKRPHLLVLVFENGERRRFDMSALMDERPFSVLKNSPVFLQARVENGTVAWPGDIDIAPETLYDGSVALPFETPPASLPDPTT